MHNRYEETMTQTIQKAVKAQEQAMGRKAECERLEKELSNLADNILADEHNTHIAGTLKSELFKELQ